MKSHSLGASLLSIPPLDLASNLKDLVLQGIDFIHLDIMDANFVPNLAFNYETCNSIKSLANDLPLDVHFMVSKKALKALLPSFFKLNARWMTFHVEEHTSTLNDLFEECHSHGVKPGLAINPDTDLSCIEPYLKQCEVVLLMSVPPGYGGQIFNESTFQRIQILDSWRVKQAYKYLIEVDGGINLFLAKKLQNLHTDLIVIGSDLIKQTDKKSYIHKFHDFSA
jgi:ribulose-phosphate 3-epimerase